MIASHWECPWCLRPKLGFLLNWLLYSITNILSIVFHFQDILIDTRHAITSISINPMKPFQLAVGCKDSTVRLFDRRALGTTYGTRSVYTTKRSMRGMFCQFKPNQLKDRSSCRVTSLKFRLVWILFRRFKSSARNMVYRETFLSHFCCLWMLQWNITNKTKAVGCRKSLISSSSHLECIFDKYVF